MKKIVCIDMDNVLVDFQSGINRITKEEKKQYEGHLDDVPGIFSLMDPIPGAIEAIHQLARHFELYILSTAPWKNPSAWTDKVLWIQKYFGDEKDSIFYKKIIITHQKNMVMGDFLVDDRDKGGVREFRGEWIHFDSEKFPGWETVTKYLTSKV